MRKRLGGIEGMNVLRGLGQAALAALGMGIALIWWVQAQIASAPWLSALGGIALGGIVYVFGVWLLKVPEIQQLKSLIRHRLP